MASRPPADLWRLLLLEAGEAEIEEAAGVSVAEAERDLAKAGFDVAAERRRAAERLRKLGG